MADDLNQGPHDGPYQYNDEALNYANLISGVINPSAASPYGATPMPAAAAAAPKAAVAPAPAHAPAPAPAPAASPSPSAVTRSGDPSQPAASSTWADMVKSGRVKLGQDQGELQRLQQTGPGVSQIKNPFLRGLARVGDVAATAIAPGLASAIPGTTMHNRQLQGIEQGRIAQDEKGIQTASTAQDQEAQMQERGAKAAKENAQATAYTPVTLGPEQAAAIGHPELAGEQMDQRAYATMLNTVQKGKNSLDVTTANNTAKKDIATGNNETKKDIATQTNQTRKDIATDKNTTSEDVAKIRHAGKTTIGGTTPQREQQRQAMIAASTDKVNKLNTYAFDQDANDGHGGFYDPASPTRVYSPEEFTAMKNQIAGDLDKQLTAKKFAPLGVKFDVKTTTPNMNAQPAQSAQPAKAQPKQQAAVRDGGGAQLTDKALAQQYLAKAGGDKDKARQLAQKDNWKF